MKSNSINSQVLLRTEILDGIVRVALHDPSSRNSFSVRAAEELLSIVERDLPSAKGLIFTSEGRVFCSGGNLSDYAAMTDPEQGKGVNRRITEVLRRVARAGKPTLCVVNGDCFGGGLELMSAFDQVIAAPHVILGFWQRKIGLSFGWGGGARLEARIGTHNLKRFALAAANLGAQEALRHGLIDAIVPEAFLMREAEKRIQAMSGLPSAPIAPMKFWETSRETEIFESLWWNPEHRAVLARR